MSDRPHRIGWSSYFAHAAACVRARPAPVMLLILSLYFARYMSVCGASCQRRPLPAAVSSHLLLEERVD